MSKIIRTYAENQGKAMLIAALAAIFLGWLAFSPDAAGKSTLYYFLQVMAIPADLFKAVINLVVPILVSSAIFVVAAGGAATNNVVFVVAAMLVLRQFVLLQGLVLL